MLVIDNGGRNDEGCIGDLVVGEAFMSGLPPRSAGARIAIPRDPCDGRPRLEPRHVSQRSARIAHAGRDRARSAANIGSHVTVTLEDYVFADDDGVVVVATADLARIVETAKDIAAREGAQAVRLLKGELLRTQLDLDRYVAKRNADPDYTFRDHLKSFGGAIEI